MKIGSNCSGECCVCAGGGEGFCLAGHGDDDFVPASKEHIIENLDNNRYSSYRKYMINYLSEHYNYHYTDENRVIQSRSDELEVTTPDEIREICNFVFSESNKI